MKYSILALTLSISSVSAWASFGRRELLQQVSSAAAVVAPALACPLSSSASLLDEFGTDPGKIVQKEPEKPAIVISRKGEQAIDPTLKGSYYYPTAKKRYLPRILKVSNGISDVSNSIEREEWDNVKEFFKDADNAVLPMKLYVSSLDGQGLSMSNSYAKQMKGQSDIYEKNVSLLSKAIQSQNKDQAAQAILKMGVAVTEYRLSGRLTDDDGNIPSVDEMRRMAMRKPTVAIAQK